jgi:xanthine/uracil permease
MFRAVPKTPFSITLFTLTFLAVVLFALFGKDFSAVLAILASAAIGLSLYLIRKLKERKENTK